MLTFLFILSTFALIGVLIVLYYEVYEPIWRERKKAKSSKTATAKEIDNLLFEAGIFNRPQEPGAINEIHLN